MKKQHIETLPAFFEGAGEVKGMRFERIAVTNKAYTYMVKVNNDFTMYETFLRKSTPKCLDFEKRLYSDTNFKETYPKSKDFGVSAWVYRTKERALNKLKIISR